MKPWVLTFVLLFAITENCFCQSLTLQTFSSGGTSVSPLFTTVGQPIASSPVASTNGNLESGFAPSITAFSSNFPPAIVYTAESAFIHDGDKLKVTVTDADGISKVTLFRRSITNATFDSVAMTSGANNGFESTILTAHFDEIGIEYFFKALDNTGRRAAKLDVNGKYFHRYKDAEGAAVPPTAFNIGDKSADYKIITIPYTLQVPGIGSQFNELGEQHDAVYRLATYAGNAKWNEYPSSAISVFERGKGYWFLTTKTDASLFLEGESTPQNYRGNLFQMTLQPEWNQIGNPYPVAINWNDVIDYNDNANLGTLKIFNNGYADGNELKPYEGGFVRNSGTTPITISIPFKGQTTPGGRIKTRTFFSELDAPHWLLQLRLTNGKISNAVSAIGMHPDASLGWDFFDDVYPPRFADFLELRFDRSENQVQLLSKDLVPRQDVFVWSFVLDAAQEQDAQLEWDNEHFGNNTIELYLFDESNMQLVNMRAFTRHRVKKGVRYKIYYGENIRSAIKPSSIGISSPYPNPYKANSNDGLKIPFGLSDGQRHNADVQILDGQGKLIRTILSQSLEPGFYEPTWDGKDNREQTCSSGIYLVRLTVSSGQQQKQFYSRVLIK